ncbi:A24 family peptidase [Acidipropionibacterium timonense]|uniref:leader peptidase (prepilin peptidase)/N-methyltransferase n=1 Tax=Acidipropionibacterium timonense TaxID=2161818 RepID=UPI0010320FD6|nr:leader peptidase (prepilin peptidase)/N-methyltransferase [Acidipropionibacterium timonense]
MAVHALLGAVVAAVLALTHTRLIVPQLPEPRVEDVGDDVVAAKPAYATLAGPGRQVVVTAIAGLAGAVAVVAPPWARPLWWVWAGSVTSLVAVDVETTFLPRLLWRLCLAEGLLALALGVVLVGPRWTWLITVPGCAAAAALPFWAAWRWTGQLGFGDVRLALGTGALTATLGVSALGVGLLGATLTGALGTLTVTVIRRWRPSPWGEAVPYGPALWAGPWIALATRTL